MVSDAVLLCTVTLRVSAPSVLTSAAMGIRMVAVPLELMVAVPLNAPPVMSAADTPESVYASDVPAATKVVLRVKVAIDPSSTVVLLALRL